MSQPLSSAVPGRRIEMPSAAGRLSYYVAGKGPPLLLIHSINAAASVAEVAPLHLHAMQSRTVYSVDLPGFGFSERGPRNYTVDLYVAALDAMLDQIAEDGYRDPVDVAALSLSAEFLARLAIREPARFRSLILITPTGFRQRDLRNPGTGTREVSWLLGLLQRERIGAFLFHRLTRPGVIRYFLNRTFGTRDISEELWRYSVKTADQTGARHAPVAFLSGGLFSRDISQVYHQLEMPVWLAHGTRGDFADFSGADWVRTRDNWRMQGFATGALPHFEVAEEFLAAFDSFLDSSPELLRQSDPPNSV